MDPSYVAWSVEQLRKQKMLKDGLGFAFNILLHEAELDPDVAARVLLAKGDIYRDMENYQAARIEYEGLKNNNRYNKTDAGSRAVLPAGRPAHRHQGLLRRRDAAGAPGRCRHASRSRPTPTTCTRRWPSRRASSRNPATT